MEYALIAGGVVVVAAVVFVMWRIEQRRRQALAAFAASKGMKLRERDDAVVARFSRYGDPFDRGFDREGRNVMHGAYDGRTATAFDYRYHTWETRRDSHGNTRRERKDHDMNVVAITHGFDFPDLSVRPEGFLGRAVGRLTGSDIELESDVFNRAFTVNSDDRRFATDVLHPRMMEWLLQHQDVAWRLVEDHVLIIRRGRLDPSTLEAGFAFCDGVLDGLPRHLTETPHAG